MGNRRQKAVSPANGRVSSEVENSQTASGRLDRGAAAPHPDEENDRFHVEEVGDRWLHVAWNVSQKTADRARSAMGREMHGHRRVLRVHRIDQGESAPPSKFLLMQIDIPEGGLEWFVHLPADCLICQIELGMAFGKNRFFSLLHSSPFTRNQQLLHRRSGSLLGFPANGEESDSGDPPPLAVQGTFVLNGETRCGVRILVDDRDVVVDPATGRFEWKLPLSNGRVVVPVRATEAGQVRRALLAIETHFHLLAPESTSDE
ncbi:MAG TPA: DUF4912 domain-containing protein [Planctomicrobium sp.]|nr:DUF4912 domain-containing protein [Planctomicrobium sp.]